MSSGSVSTIVKCHVTPTGILVVLKSFVIVLEKRAERKRSRSSKYFFEVFVYLTSHRKLASNILQTMCYHRLLSRASKTVIHLFFPHTRTTIHIFIISISPAQNPSNDRVVLELSLALHHAEGANEIEVGTEIEALTQPQ